jgi:hypothetical protein
VAPFRQAAERLAVSAELGRWVAKLGEVLFDMRVQDRRERTGIDLELVRHPDRDTRRPCEPGVAEIPGSVEEQLLRCPAVDQLLLVPLDLLLALQAEEVLLAPNCIRQRVGSEGSSPSSPSASGTGLALGLTAASAFGSGAGLLPVTALTGRWVTPRYFVGRSSSFHSVASTSIRPSSAKTSKALAFQPVTALRETLRWRANSACVRNLGAAAAVIEAVTCYRGTGFPDPGARKYRGTDHPYTFQASRVPPLVAGMSH